MNADPDYKSFSHQHHSYMARSRYADQLEVVPVAVPGRAAALHPGGGLLRRPRRGVRQGARVPRPAAAQPGRLQEAQRLQAHADGRRDPPAPRGALRRLQRAAWRSCWGRTSPGRTDGHRHHRAGTTSPGPPEAAAEEEREGRRRHLGAWPAAALLNLVGAVGTGVLTFALVTVLTRGLGAASYGAFVSAMGLFTILSNTAELGADTGLVRSISRLRALGPGPRHPQDASIVALLPPLVVSTLFGLALWMWAPQLAEIFGKGEGRDQIADFARWMAPFLPAAGRHPGDPVRHPGLRHDDPERGGRQARPPLHPGGRWRWPSSSWPGTATPITASSPWRGLCPSLLGAVGGLWWLWGLLLKDERRDRRTNGRRRSRPTTRAGRRSSGASPPPGAWPASSRSSCCGSTRCSSGGSTPPRRPASSTPPPATSPPGSWSVWPSSRWPARSSRS